MPEKIDHIFSPARIVGQVCTGVPFAIEYEPNCSRIGVVYIAVENTINVYSLRPIKFRHSTTPCKNIITHVAVHKKKLYVVSGDELLVYEQKKLCVNSIKLKEKVVSIVPVGSVISIVYINGDITTYSLVDFEILSNISSPDDFIPTVAIHPQTYENKILIGSDCGKIRLVNTKKAKLIHEFQRIKMSNTKITCMAQSPAIDIIAFGFTCGLITLRNIKLDEILMTFQQDGQITGITFRNDGVESMITTSDEGSIAVWDLNEQSLVGITTSAHDGMIVKVEALNGQPFLLTSGKDNRVVKWSFDENQCLPEPHTIVEGHGKPMNFVKYLDDRIMISSSLDGTLRRNSAKGPVFFKRMGRVESQKKKYIGKDVYQKTLLNPIVEIAGNMAREPVWDNIICRHEDSPFVSCWSTRKDTQGKNLLFQDVFFNNPSYAGILATSICISNCGNFAFVGYSTGHVNCYNIQSGKFKCSFVDKSLGEKNIAIEGLVIGVAVDVSSKKVIVASQNGGINFYERHSKSGLICKMNSTSSIEKISLHTGNNLLAVASTDGHISLIDTINYSVGRKFVDAHKNCKITAIEQSPDGKWLVSADDKSRIKVWDLIVSELIDIIVVPHFCTGLSFSPDGAFLSTILNEKNYVFVWSNRTYYDDSIVIKPIRDYDTLPTEVISLPQFEMAPIFEGEEEEGEDKIVERFNEVMDCTLENGEIVKNDNLLKLSGYPEIKWASLPYLDVIKERNKPTSALKKPKNAPFFLPSIQTINGFEFVAPEDNSAEYEKNIAIKRKNLELITTYASQLLKCQSDEDLLLAFDTLRNMTVSSIQYQIKSLPYNSLHKFFNMMTLILSKRIHIELVEHYIALCIKEHRSFLWSDEEADDDESINKLTQAIENYMIMNEQVYGEFKKVVPHVSSLLKWIKSSTV
uniref:Utp21 domain-containing protein n=1 Tax=Strongyloides stercoralis TaxID=6248 RepID=A0A0K0E137_STRER